jgi:hypothetical protein
MTELSFEIWLRERLHGGSNLQALQRTVIASDRAWVEKLRVRRTPEHAWTPIDTADNDALANAFRELAFGHGDTYAALVAEHGPPPFARNMGGLELRGSGSGREVYAEADDYVLAPRWDDAYFANCVFGGAGVADVGWLEELLQAAALELPLAWATAYADVEYQAKNMTPRRALGRDVLKWLPGLYWLNVFGEPYTDLLGDDVLASVPAHRVERLGDCWGLWLSESPVAWRSWRYRRRARRVLAHLGPTRFFDRGRDHDPDPTERGHRTMKVVIP